MKKTALISQPFGCGDCCFAQGVAHHIRQQGFDIVWPVQPQFVDGLSRAYPNIRWCPDTIVKPELFQIKEDKEVDGVRIIPIRWSDSIIGCEQRYWMKAKHLLYELDYTKWKDHAKYSRRPKREHKLARLKKIVNPYTEEYVLVNHNFRSNSGGYVPIQLPPEYEGLKVVTMDIQDGFSIFDYSLLIENATYIHAANSAILYLLELLNLRAKEVHLYCRKPDEQDFRYVDYLFTKDYILHY